MFNIQQFAMNMLMNSPNVKGNPVSEKMVQTIQNGDNNAGEQMARNLCNSYGVTPEEALKQAREFFHI